MDCINIAGVNCRVDKLNTMSYEALFDMALTSTKYYQKTNAKSDIDRELRDNGFKPTHKVTDQVTADNIAESSKAFRTRDSSKQRRNRKSSKE